MGPHDLRTVADLLRQGGLIAYPSESVYGIGCLPDNPKAVKRLLDIKRRHSEKGLILVAGSMAQLKTWIAPLDAAEIAKIEEPRERATTWIVPARNTTPELLTGSRPTIAIRISRHPLIKALCKACNSALVSTSANVSGEEAARSAGDIDQRITKKLDLIIDEACLGEARPSQIIDLQSGAILRD